MDRQIILTNYCWRPHASIVVLFILFGCQSQDMRQDSLLETYEVFNSDSNINMPYTDEDIEFTREYTYFASEDDSKNSSRKKALEQIKILLSEEIGVYIESYLEINKIDSSDVTRQSVSHEIKSLSSGITRIKVLDERWNGKTYYVKASVKTNAEQAIASLLEAIKAKSAKSEIDRLNLIISEQGALLNQSREKTTDLQKDIVRQELIYEARQSERIESKSELIRTNEEQLLQERMLAEDRKQIEKIKRIVKESKEKRDRKAKQACLIEKGMTQSEVKQALGEPEHGGNTSFYYYGEIRIGFNYISNRVSSLSGCGFY